MSESARRAKLGRILTLADRLAPKMISILSELQLQAVHLLNMQF